MGGHNSMNGHLSMGGHNYMNGHLPMGGVFCSKFALKSLNSN